MIRIKISSDFSEIPGGRLKIEGKHSGEEFRDELLLPKYREAEENNTELEVDFDDCYGIGTSFLEEAFGGLIRVNQLSLSNVSDHIIIISEEEPYLKDDIEEYMRDAENEKEL